MKDKFNIATLIISGIFALFGTMVGAFITGYYNVKLAEQKYQSDLILKALESNSSEERLQTLKLLVHTNLIKESSVRDSVSNYIFQKQKDTTDIPQVKSSLAQSLDPPIINDARVYLLTGNKAKTDGLGDLSKQLNVAGYKVLGSKYIVDNGRPDNTEVRYFNIEDQAQAEKIAEFLQFKLNDKSFLAKYYSDAKAKSGYIEIWLGR